VPVVNIEGVPAARLRFTGPLLADIFLGKLRKWNDPAIRAINPDISLPNASITVVHRTDGSGTTFNWAADWASTSDFYLVMTNAAGERAYPITATSFILMYKQAKDPSRSKVALELFKRALEHGQKEADELEYVPMPASVVKQIEAYCRTTFGFVD
jgi:ABC-type phosphate transport system substrate-binding protein